MKKIVLQVCMLLLLNIGVSAQKKWGIVAGGGFSQVAGFDLSGSGTDPLFVVQAAVYTIMPLGKKNVLVLKPSLGYAPRGANFINVPLTNLAGTDIGSGNLKRRLDYIQLSLPVAYKMQWGNVTALLGAGPYASYAISGREVRNTRFSQLYANEKIIAKVDFDKQSISRFDAGLTVHFTTVFPANWCAGLNVDLGLTKVNSEGSGSIRNQYAGVYVGYVF